MGYINPLLKLPAGKALAALPREQRASLEVATYARHAAHALSRGPEQKTPAGPFPRLQATIPVISLTWCASDSDGDCAHSQCPQLRDGEPLKSGRSCPVWKSIQDRGEF